MKQYLLIVIITIIIFTACSTKQAAEENTATKEQTAVTLNDAQLKNAGIVIDTAVLQTVHATIKANGAVDVPPQSMVSVSFPLGGYLKSTSLLPGAFVKRGAVIAVMEDQSYVQLQQDYLTSKAKMEYLNTDMQRQKELSDADASSKKNYQLVLSEYKTQEILIRSLEEKLKIIGIQPENLSVNNISRTVAVYSPINGYVTKVNVNIGKYVNPTDVLFELVNPDDIHAAITVFEKDIKLFHQGMKGKVFLIDDPAKTYNVEVILVTKNIDDNRSGLVHCHFENEDHNLLPGMFLTGVFELENVKARTVPDDAVVRYGSNDFIFITKDGKRFSMQPVTVGVAENGYTALQISDSTILLNNRIATKGAYALLGMLKNKMEE